MTSPFSLQNRANKQSQIYDDLSNFLQIQQTAINIQKGSDYAQLIEKIKTLSDDIEVIMVKYKDGGPLPIEQMTFHRFICRMLEILTVLRIKYQAVAYCHSINCFVTCLKEIQGVVRRCEEEQLFARIVQLSQIVFIKFCMSCTGNIKMGSSSSPECIEMSDSMKKMSERMADFKQKQKNSRQKSYLHLSYSFNSEKEILKDVEQRKSKIPIISHNLSEIQKRYDTFKGMDIDYTSFKTSYFQAKNSYDSFYKDCLQRNASISRIITQYHDDFQLLKKRKETKVNRKNKRMKTNDFSNQIRDKSVEEALKHNHYENHESIRIKKNKANQTCDERSLKQKLFTQSKEITASNADLDANKVSYKMKNVYITLNKKSISRQPYKNSIPPNILKKKILQTQSNNQSFVNDLAEHQKSPTIYFQDKLKQISQEKFEQCLKTQTEKTSTSPVEKDEDSSEKIIEDKVIGYVSSPSTAEFKGRRLEISCATVSKQTFSKSRLLNKPHNKFSVKLQERGKFVIGVRQV